MDYQKEYKSKKNRSEEELADLKERIILIMDKMEEKIPTNTIPIQSEDLHYQVARIYGDLGETASMKKIMETLIARENGKPLNRVDYANTFYRELNDTELAINTLEDMRSTYLQLESMVRSRGFGNSTVRKGEWARWEKAYSEIISSLIFIYRETNKLEEAENHLIDWIKRNPNDSNAKDILSKIQN